MSETAPISGDTRDRRIGEALNAYLDRRKLGTAEPEAEFLARQPDLADDLRLHLAMLGELQPVTPRIDALIARGVLRTSADPGYAAELGPYRIVRSLGAGAMGVVLLAYEERLRRSVALKILRPELAADAAALTRFTREARAAAALHHPHLITVYTVGEEQGVHFLAMEYVDGPTLAEVIRAEEGKRRGDGWPATSGWHGQAECRASGTELVREKPATHPPLPFPDEWPTSSAVEERFEHATQALPIEHVFRPIDPRSAHSERSADPGAPGQNPQVTQHSCALPTDLIGELFRQLLTGLAAAHGAGLIHRDIKPSNILLDGWGGVDGGGTGGHRDEGTKQENTPRNIDPASRSAGWPTSSEAGERWEGGPPVRKPGSTAAQPNPQTAIRDPQSAQHAALRTQHFAVKIADFGLARMLNAQTRVTLPAAVLGTPEYMSPEQARGESADHPIDHRADLYAAGVVLYEMLTGRTPFRADSSSVVLHRILHDEPAHPRTITPAADPHLSSLALRLMAKRPEDRFASAAEGLAALEAGGHIALLEQRRRVRRQATVVLGVLAVVVGTGWLAGRPGGFWDRLSRRSDTGVQNVSPTGSGAPAPITEVMVETQEQADSTKVTTRTILARYGDDPAWHIFFRFPPEAIRVVNAILIKDDQGRGALVAATFRAYQGHCLFGFDPEKGPLPDRWEWSLDLTDPRQWPDCDQPNTFGCNDLAAADLDGRPGEELLVAAVDGKQYATRLCIVDPRTREIRSSFFHMGQLVQVLVVPDFLGPGRPGIVARGQSNVLDGFKSQGSRDAASLTLWDIVPVLVVLDPRQMDGLGPPFCPRVDLPPAMPVSYAYLDLSASEYPPPDTGPVDRARRIPMADEWVSLEHVRLDSYSDDLASVPCLSVSIARPGANPNGAALTLTRNLDIRADARGHADYWRGLWHPIVQDGKYVDEAAEWANQPMPPP